MLDLLTSNWMILATSGVVFCFVLLFLLSTRPDAAVLMVLFFMYSNVAVIAKHFYDLPFVVAASFSLLLAFPVAHYLVIQRKRTVIDIPLVLMMSFLFVLLLSCFLGAIDLIRALEWITTYFLEGLLLYFLVINVIRNIETLRRVVWVLLLAGSLLGALTLYQEVTHSYHNTFWGLVQRGTVEEGSKESPYNGDASKKAGSGRNGINRAAGPIGDPNRYGQIMVVLLPLAFFSYWRERSRWLKAAGVTATVLILCGVLLTYSRGAFVAILIMIFIMAAMRYIRIYQLMISMAVLGILIPFAAPGYLERIETIRGVQGIVSKASGVKPDSTTRGRATEMLAALHAFFDYPMLGVGPAQYSKFYSVKYMSIPEVAFKRITKTRRAHCLYTELAAETGIVGFSTFMGIVFFIMYQLWKMQRYFVHSRPDLSKIAGSLLISIVAYLGTSVFLHLSYQRYYWLLLGIAGAGVQILASEKEKTEGSVQDLA